MAADGVRQGRRYWACYWGGVWLGLVSGACHGSLDSNANNPEGSGGRGLAMNGEASPVVAMPVLDAGPVPEPLAFAGDSESPRGQGDVCERVEVVAEPVRPEMMVALDRSSSMADGERWGPSVEAIVQLVGALEAQIDFGLALFPGPDAATYPCEAGRVEVPVGFENGAAIAGLLRAARPQGGTPTAEMLRQLLTGYALAGNGEQEKYVLLVTDGQPTCAEVGSLNQVTGTADILAVNAALEALAAQGVQTYVIGYNTRGDTELAAALDGFAQRGGTGEARHRAVENGQGLIAEFKAISASLVSCTYELAETPTFAENVIVALDGQVLQSDSADGFSLRDGGRVVLGGAACGRLRNGLRHELRVEVICPLSAPL